MLDADLTILNNIMLSSSNGLITVAEQQQYTDYVFLNEKSYYDVCLAILQARQVSNTKINAFYLYAKTMGFNYTVNATQDDILWVGSK